MVDVIVDIIIDIIVDIIVDIMVDIIVNYIHPIFTKLDWVFNKSSLVSLDLPIKN